MNATNDVGVTSAHYFPSMYKCRGKPWDCIYDSGNLELIASSIVTGKESLSDVASSILYRFDFDGGYISWGSICSLWQNLSFPTTKDDTMWQEMLLNRNNYQTI